MPGGGAGGNPCRQAVSDGHPGPVGVERPLPEGLGGLSLACASSRLAEPCSGGTEDNP